MTNASESDLPWHNMKFMTEVGCNRLGHVLNVAHSDPLNETDRPTLVLFHGVLRNWHSFYPLLPSLKDRFRLVAVDFRGHGQSARRPSAYRVVDYVEDAVNVIDSLSGVVHLYGHSLGAMVALATCARLPDRIATAVLEDPPFSTMGHRITQLPLLPYFQGVESCVNNEFSTYPQAGDSTSEMNERIDRLFCSFSDLIVGRQPDGSAIRIRDQRDEVARRFSAECFARLDPQVLQPITSGQWLDGFDLKSILPAVKANVILMQADDQAGGMLTDDEASLVSDALDRHCRKVRFDGIGHSIHWANPDRIVSLLSQL